MHHFRLFPHWIWIVILNKGAPPTEYLPWKQTISKYEQCETNWFFKSTTEWPLTIFLPLIQSIMLIEKLCWGFLPAEMHWEDNFIQIEWDREKHFDSIWYQDNEHLIFDKINTLLVSNLECVHYFTTLIMSFWNTVDVTNDWTLEDIPRVSIGESNISQCIGSNITSQRLPICLCILMREKPSCQAVMCKRGCVL